MGGMKIRALEKFQKRHARGSYFEDLPPDLRQKAVGWLQHFKQRRWAQGLGIPNWLGAIYVGQARRLALNPPTSGWGRSMLAKRGGLAVQRKYRRERRRPTERVAVPRAQVPPPPVLDAAGRRKLPARGGFRLLPPGHVVTIDRGTPKLGRF